MRCQKVSDKTDSAFDKYINFLGDAGALTQKRTSEILSTLEEFRAQMMWSVVF